MKRKPFFLSIVLFVLSISLVSCNNSNQKTSTGELTYSYITPNIAFSIINIYPHDTSAFTQGLQYYKGKLLESTGDYQNSSLRIVDLHSGNVLKKHLMGSQKIFGEGATVLNQKIFQLTWKNNIVFIYDEKNINMSISTLSWPKEGWGITNDGINLIVSDGSSFLYFVDPKTFQIIRKIQVIDNNQPQERLNELEFTNDGIYANVFETNNILRIDSQTGNVTGIIDCTTLVRTNNLEFINNPEKVLNGIAYDSSQNRMFITGKLWPVLFEIKLKK